VKPEEMNIDELEKLEKTLKNRLEYISFLIERRIINGEKRARKDRRGNHCRFPCVRAYEIRALG
jgi:hypothetical protein